MTLTLRTVAAALTLVGSLALAGAAFAQTAPVKPPARDHKAGAPKATAAQTQIDKACKAHAKGSLQHRQCVRQQLAKSQKTTAGKPKPPMTLKKADQKA